MQNGDALELEIASADNAIRVGQLELAEIEKSLQQKKQRLDSLTMEVNILRRAASLRPSAQS